MKETVIDLMEQLTKESIEVIKELMTEEVKPLIDYRTALEKKIGNKEIKGMYSLEEEAR